MKKILIFLLLLTQLCFAEGWLKNKINTSKNKWNKSNVKKTINNFKKNIKRQSKKTYLKYKNKINIRNIKSDIKINASKIITKTKHKFSKSTKELDNIKRKINLKVYDYVPHKSKNTEIFHYNLPKNNSKNNISNNVKIKINEFKDYAQSNYPKIKNIIKDKNNQEKVMTALSVGGKIIRIKNTIKEKKGTEKGTAKKGTVY